MAVYLTCYGGVGAIGGNKLLLESGDRALWLDFGTDFQRRSLYYNDLLAPRSASGLRDPLAMGLIPPIEGIYRDDLAGPAADLWPALREGAGAATPRAFDPTDPPPVLLSHAHLDHCGAISFLSAQTSVYASAPTAALLKACQDTTSNDFESEVAYVVPRDGREGLVVASNYRTTPAIARRVAAVGASDRLAAFWRTPSASRDIAGSPLQEWEPGRGIASLSVQVYPVDHSVPGAVAWAVQTEGGWVVYTGDLRRHGARADDTRAFVSAAAALHPLALICEGTHPAAEWPDAEAAVYENACHVVRLSNGLVFADFSARNVERLATFRRVAAATGRRLVITARDAYILEALSLVDAADDPRQSDDLLIYGEAKLSRPSWERIVLERYGDRVITARRLSRDGGAYIVCFSYYDLPEFIDIAPRSGTYIYSASEARDEEARFDLARLRAWLNRFGMRFVGDPAAAAGGRFHASGHIDGPGLLELIETIAPRWVIPVHTLDTRFFRRYVERKRLLLPQPGQRCRLA